MTFDLWVEGFSISGNDGSAQFIGRADGDTFKDACARWFDVHPSGDYDPKRNTYWGCRLFPNEADARKSFG